MADYELQAKADSQEMSVFSSLGVRIEKTKR